MLIIEKDIPVPTGKGTRPKTKCRVDLEQAVEVMNIGDSVYLAFAAYEGCSVRPVKDYILNCIRCVQKATPFQYRTRQDENGIRFWLLEKGNGVDHG